MGRKESNQTNKLSFETDLMPFTQNVIKKKYAYYQRIM